MHRNMIVIFKFSLESRPIGQHSDKNFGSLFNFFGVISIVSSPNFENSHKMSIFDVET